MDPPEATDASAPHQQESIISNQNIEIHTIDVQLENREENNMEADLKEDDCYDNQRHHVQDNQGSHTKIEICSDDILDIAVNEEYNHDQRIATQDDSIVPSAPLLQEDYVDDERLNVDLNNQISHHEIEICDNDEIISIAVEDDSIVPSAPPLQEDYVDDEHLNVELNNQISHHEIEICDNDEIIVIAIEDDSKVPSAPPLQEDNSCNELTHMQTVSSSQLVQDINQPSLATQNVQTVEAHVMTHFDIETGHAKSLPVASPITETEEVEVYAYVMEEPRHVHRFYIPPSEQPAVAPVERDPIFSDVDKANPFYCMIKLIGIIICIPIYAMYWLFFNGGVLYLLKTVQSIIFKLFTNPLFYILDYLIYVFEYAIWFFYSYFLRPIYVYIIVPLWRLFIRCLVCIWDGICFVVK